MVLSTIFLDDIRILILIWNSVQKGGQTVYKRDDKEHQW